jgi:hypothetical protein
MAISFKLLACFLIYSIEYSRGGRDPLFLIESDPPKPKIGQKLMKVIQQNPKFAQTLTKVIH